MWGTLRKQQNSGYFGQYDSYFQTYIKIVTVVVIFKQNQIQIFAALVQRYNFHYYDIRQKSLFNFEKFPMTHHT